MELQKIDHINIVVNDVEAACGFFVELGFEVQFKKEISGKWIDQVVGLQDVRAKFVALSIPGASEDQAVLELLEYSNPIGNTNANISKANQIGFRHIALRVTDIEQWYAMLRKKGVDFYSEPQSAGSVGGQYATKKLCYFTGPDGIIIEIMEY